MESDGYISNGEDGYDELTQVILKKIHLRKKKLKVKTIPRKKKHEENDMTEITNSVDSDNENEMPDLTNS